MKSLFACLFLLSTVSHDIQVAYFKIYKKGDILMTDVIFEKDDLLEILGNEESELLGSDVVSYLKLNFALKINNASIDLDFGEAVIKDNHVYVSGSFSQPIESISLIEINNNCLLRIKNHSNIIQLRLYDEERDFLMNSERTNIKIKY